jgi:hypothetical protein
MRRAYFYHPKRGRKDCAFEWQEEMDMEGMGRLRHL